MNTWSRRLRKVQMMGAFADFLVLCQRRFARMADSTGWTSAVRYVYYDTHSPFGDLRVFIYTTIVTVIYTMMTKRWHCIHLRKSLVWFWVVIFFWAEPHCYMQGRMVRPFWIWPFWAHRHVLQKWRHVQNLNIAYLQRIIDYNDVSYRIWGISCHCSDIVVDGLLSYLNDSSHRQVT